ncbi:MAG: hypothetical protein EP343_03520 [Deltaproteobacteria bacterium]|nr:MAG: hypothetical protein EP343_03520 [Deltaproteobacteria bacterium]
MSTSRVSHKYSIVAFVFQWVASGLAATGGVLLYTRDLETAAFGLLSGTFLLVPSLLALGVHLWTQQRVWTVVSYLVPLVLVWLWLGVGWWIEGQKRVTDGSDQWLAVTLVSLSVGGLVGALWLGVMKTKPIDAPSL